MNFDNPKVYGDTSITDGLVLIWTLSKLPLTKVAEVVRRHEGPLPKSLDPDEDFKL